ncbi:MAG: hypothetical protein ABL962_08785 [Fimbriimonadaceae bacterium]
MYRAFLLLLTVLATAILAADSESFALIDGSKLNGRVMSSTVSEVTILTDFGVLRLGLDKLTPESRAKVIEGSKPDVDALLRRIAELEAKVSQLQQENESLRRQAVATPVPTYRPPSGAQSLTPPGSTTKPATRGSYTISSTGKRHNSGCRYFGSGRSCGATDGIACKICGG